MLHFFKVLKSISFPLVVTPLTMFNLTSNNYDVDNISLKDNFVNQINKIENDYNNSQFNISFNNVAVNGNFNYDKKLFTYGENLDELKNKLLNRSLYNVDKDTYDNKSCIQELITGKIENKNNSYLIFPNNKITRKTSYSKVCSNGYHNQLLPACGYNHIHNRGCMKTTKVKCRGCIPTTENLNYELSYNIDQFSNYFKNNYIDNKVFDFSKLIKVDYKNSFKSFNKNVLKFEFNKIYLKSKILNSFNNFYADYFFQSNQTKIDSEILNLLTDKIKENLLTDFGHYINKFLNINSKTWGSKHNISYWLEAIKYKDKNQIINELNDLNSTDVNQYLTTNNDKSINNYLWYQMYLIFNNKTLLKNINYEITYYTKLNSNNPVRKINLIDLYNNVNNDITYRIDNLNIVHNFEDQAIYVSDINLKSDNLNAYFNASNIGLIYNDELNNVKDLIKTPLISNGETWFKYNPKIDMNNIFTIKNYNLTDSKMYLLKNNLDQFSDLYKDDKLIEILTNLKSSPYITLKDLDWLNNLNDSNINLSSEYFSLYVKNISLKHYLSNGSVKFEIILADDNKIHWVINGFKVQLISFNKKYDVINSKDMNIDKNLIDKEYVLNNLLSFNDISNTNCFGFINTTKADFLDNLLIDLSIDKLSTDNYVINLSYKDNLNYINKHQFRIVDQPDNIVNKPDDNPNKPGDNDNQNNNIDNNNPNNDNKNQSLYWLILIPILVVILIVVGYLLFKNKIKDKNNVKK